MKKANPILLFRFDPKKIDQLFLINKHSDPLTAFYEMLIVETGNEEAVLNGKRPQVGSVVINKTLYETEVLERILPKYAKKLKGNYFTSKHMELSIAMLDLDIGPHTSPDVPENEIWLLKDWLV